jgi:hypothetical protein
MTSSELLRKSRRLRARIVKRGTLLGILRQLGLRLDDLT